jgi:fructosamine-3-kinase
MWNLIREKSNNKSGKQNYIEKLNINNSVINDAQEIATAFSEYFVDIIDQIKSQRTRKTTFHQLKSIIIPKVCLFVPLQQLR